MADLGREALAPSVERVGAAVSERFIVPARTSRRPRIWVAGHAVLATPFVVVGTERRYSACLDGVDVRVLCVGREERFRPFLTRVLAGHAQLEGTSRGRLVWSPSRFWPVDASLVAVELHRWLAARFRAAGWLVCPEFVRWQGSLSSMPPSKPSESLRTDLRRLARGGYGLDAAAGSVRDWAQFERDMVIPYAKRRFGDEAWIPSSGYLRAVRARGKLLFVTKDGERVAGACVLRGRKEAWVVAVGVRDGDIDLMRGGAIAAVYGLTIGWARGLGVRRMDFGRTSAFQLDGIARFKRKWGMSPIRDPLSPLIAIQLAPAQPALRRAMERQPFMVETDGALRAYPR